MRQSMPSGFLQARRNQWLKLLAGRLQARRLRAMIKHAYDTSSITASSKMPIRPEDSGLVMT